MPYLLDDASDPVEGVAGYIHKLPERARYLGSAESGEIEILPEAAGPDSHSEDKSGVVYADRYVAVVRDRVLFPGGTLGTYLRIFTQPPSDEPSGAIVLPFDGRNILLRRMFRHATRCWEYEAPRGLRSEDDLTIVETAGRELSEELGIRAHRLEYLGTIYGDTGLIASPNAVFLGWITQGEAIPRPDASEALGDMVSLSLAEFLKWVQHGRVRDGFTLSAFSLALSSGHISL
jgi:ADP-ribose pyrophosphatase